MIAGLARRISVVTLSPRALRVLAAVVGRGAQSRRERCGLLIGAVSGPRVSVTRVIECENHHESDSAFALSIGDLHDGQAAARRERLRVVGVFHTHPSGLVRQSEADLDLPRTTGLLSLIAGARTRGTLRLACYGAFGRGVHPIPVRWPSAKL